MSSIFLELTEGLSIAWRAIRANKIRAALTMLGIIIGVIAKETLLFFALGGIIGIISAAIFSIIKK